MCRARGTGWVLVWKGAHLAVEVGERALGLGLGLGLGLRHLAVEVGERARDAERDR